MISRYGDSMLDRSSTSFQKVLNNTMSGPMNMPNMAALPPNSKKQAKVNKIVKDNLKKQKQKDFQE